MSPRTKQVLKQCPLYHQARKIMRCYLLTSSCTLAAFIFLTFLNNGLVEADEAKSVIDVGVYYESLCGDSMRFVRDQLLPSYELLKDNINIDFIPYGKASHWRDGETGPWQFTCQHGSAECRGNMAQACAIHAIKAEESAENVQRLTMALVGCAMSSRYPPTAVPRCAEEGNLKEATRKSINDCIEGTLSSDLHAVNGDKTLALKPDLSFVPTVTLNGAYNKETQPEVLNRFSKTICSLLPEKSKPSGCDQ